VAPNSSCIFEWPKESETTTNNKRHPSDWWALKTGPGIPVFEAGQKKIIARENWYTELSHNLPVTDGSEEKAVRRLIKSNCWPQARQFWVSIREALATKHLLTLLFLQQPSETVVCSYVHFTNKDTGAQRLSTTYSKPWSQHGNELGPKQLGSTAYLWPPACDTST
jgi:hypothetical protein